MTLLTFEDFEPGWTREYGDYRVTREEIVAFARDYDPQPFHLDEEAGRQSLLGGLAASGWHTAAITSRLNCDAFILRSACCGSPGVDELKWLKPVYPGDRLSVRTRVLAARASQSRPGVGIVSLSSECMKAGSELVMTLRFNVMFARRGASPANLAGVKRATSEANPCAAATATDPDAAATQAFGYFEDVVLGTRLDLGSHTFASDEIVRFAKAYDPQDFHMSEAAAAAGPYGGLTAPGWLTAANFMRRLVDTRAATAARAASSHASGPSPGISELSWLAPVYAGDTIRYDATLVDKRATSRPGWGLAFSHNTGVNQDGFRVFEFNSAQFWPRRE